MSDSAVRHDVRSQVHAGVASAPDGARIAYELRSGGQPGRRIALLHSLAMDRSFWHAVAAQLAGRADILLLDCRGHGQSDKPGGPYTIELFAGDLAAVFDAVGWRSAVVGGASMGGSVSLAFAANCPDRVDGLALIDTTAGYGQNAPAQWAERAQKAIDNGMAALLDFQKSRWFSDAFRRDNPHTVEDAVQVFLKNDVSTYAETCRMLGSFDVWPALPGFKCPVRIVVGDEDYATPVSVAQAMGEAIPGSSVRVIKGARHFTPLEVPDVIAEELTHLLDETQAGPSGRAAA